MYVLGLTGSIGAGKSTAARVFRRLGVPVHDADAAVHRALGPGGDAVRPVADQFPGVETGGMIDRKALGAAVFDDPARLRALEAILHPLVRRAERRFLGISARNRRPLVVLDIPLLFETGADARCDGVLVVVCSRRAQRRRVLRRPGMDRQKLDAILAQQMPSRDKEKRADFVIRTDLGKAESFRALMRILKKIRR